PARRHAKVRGVLIRRGASRAAPRCARGVAGDRPAPAPRWERTCSCRSDGGRSMSRYRYPQPANEDAFEEFCLALLREVRSLPSLDRYGHRGEEQHGVDLLDLSGKTPLLGVQCKHHDPTKTLPPAEL